MKVTTATPTNKFMEEIHDENGPTGQFVDVREIRMDDDHFHPDVLDDGVRETVLWLRANGFRTFDSGDGKKDHPCAHDFPNVWIEVMPENGFAETDRLEALLKQYGIAVNAEGPPSLGLTYDPGTLPMIRLFCVDDELLKKHGAIVKTSAPSS